MPKTVNNLRFEDLPTFSFVFILVLMLRVNVLSFLFIPYYTIIDGLLRQFFIFSNRNLSFCYGFISIDAL
jgi:hypothetical protein